MFRKISVVFQAIRAFLAILPLIRPIVEETDVPGFGPEKKEAVLLAAGALIDILPWAISDEVKSIVLKMIGAVINLIVSMLNFAGHVWPKKTDEEETT